MRHRVFLISLNRCANPDPVFPIGLAYVNGALRQAGHDTRWYDPLAEAQPLETVLADYQPTVVGISLRNIDDVLLRRQELYFNELKAVCEQIRRIVRCPVILGGSGFSIFPEQLLRLSGADYGICGGGETPMVQLVDALGRNAPVPDNPGLVRRDGDRVRLSPPQPVVPGWALGPEDRPATVVAHYLAANSTLNVQTQRGCGFHCCYCTYPILEGRTHLRRPAEVVAEEFAQAAAAGARFVFVVDSVFNSSPRHVREVCEALIRRKLRLSWGCFLRPQGLTAELVDLMRRAGLSHVEFGSDSFSDEVLQAYQKGLTFEDIRRSSQLARAAGLEVCHFVICGGPGETPATLEQSFQRSQDLDGAVVMAVVGMRVYPGTPLAERSAAEGRLSPQTDLLAPLYYVAAAFRDSDEVFDRVRAFSRSAPNWIVGEPSPAFNTMVARLRHRGVVGPLWSYAAMVQRLWPDGWSAPAAPGSA